MAHHPVSKFSPKIMQAIQITLATMQSTGTLLKCTFSLAIKLPVMVQKGCGSVSDNLVVNTQVTHSKLHVGLEQTEVQSCDLGTRKSFEHNLSGVRMHKVSLIEKYNQQLQCC